MKQTLLAGIALAGLSIGAQAATVTYDPLTAGSYFAPTTTVSSGLPTFQQGVTGSTTERTSPFGDTTSPYDSVEAGGSATFGAGTGSGSFGIGSGTFSFVWGTPDTYNELQFFEGASTTPVATVFGTGSGTGSFLATVTDLPTYDHVTFTSDSTNAFEFAAVSAVPLPGSLPMFGGAILALGVFAAWQRGGATKRA